MEIGHTLLDEMEVAEVLAACGAAAHKMVKPEQSVELLEKAISYYGLHQHQAAAARWMLGLALSSMAEPARKSQALVAFQGSMQTFQKLSESRPQTLADEKHGLKTMEIWLVTMPPGSETPVNRHYGEVVLITLKGAGLAVVDEDSVNLLPNTTLVIPAKATRHAVNTGEEDLLILLIRSLVRPPEKTMGEMVAKMR